MKITWLHWSVWKCILSAFHSSDSQAWARRPRNPNLTVVDHDGSSSHNHINILPWESSTNKHPSSLLTSLVLYFSFPTLIYSDQTNTFDVVKRMHTFQQDSALDWTGWMAKTHGYNAYNCFCVASDIVKFFFVADVSIFMYHSCWFKSILTENLWAIACAFLLINLLCLVFI